jgi:hypothetical protein
MFKKEVVMGRRSGAGMSPHKISEGFPVSGGPDPCTLGSASANERQRSNVATDTPNSRDIAVTGVLSGGSNLATARSLSACPYLAMQSPPCPSTVLSKRGDNYPDATGLALDRLAGGWFACCAESPRISASFWSVESMAGPGEAHVWCGWILDDSWTTSGYGATLRR